MKPTKVEKWIVDGNEMTEEKDHLSHSPVGGISDWSETPDSPFLLPVQIF